MTGYDEFIELFGGVTVLTLARFALAALFLYFLYKKFRDYINAKKEKLVQEHEASHRRDEQLQIALEAISKYPSYRQQSLEIQQHLESEIQELRMSQEANLKRLVQMEENNKKRELNKLRDRLLQSYRYYIDPVKNPSHSWTRMESEAFWELFKDYEDMGGNGYMHSEVQPAMTRLTIADR